jgi:creatinine amidohydrolase/Fe(II)-dependent formamide hydrolase-like protein
MTCFVCMVLALMHTTETQAAEPWHYGQMSAEQLAQAIQRCPVAYISEGIVEWHGEQNACGLDGLKAESLGRMAAGRLGGVCFPHVWLGPDTSTPFDPTKYPRGTVTIDKPLYLNVAEDLLRQIEATGFRVAVWLAGHYPGVIPDVAAKFNRRGKMKVISVSENRVVEGLPAGDHAATWETSLLMVLRPGLTDLGRLPPLPLAVGPGGEVIPSPWAFRQRCEYYGVYGSDPRIWANALFGRRGVEAVMDGLAREVGKALGDPSYGKGRPAVAWPTDDRRQPEVRYDHQLPYQWFGHFEQAPIVYVPLPAIREPIDGSVERAIVLARRTGGLVFPPLNYGPRQDGHGVSLTADLFRQVAEQVVHALAEMDFRVVVLLPDADLAKNVRKSLEDLRTTGGQTQALAIDVSHATSTPDELDRAIKRMIPTERTARRLDGEWAINGQWKINSLSEGVYGPADVRVYEHAFELSEAEAAGAVQLNLGVVENHCEVVVNDAQSMTDHWPPYRFIITGRVKAGLNRLKVTVRHKPQPTLDLFYYRVGPPRLVGPVTLTFWQP